ncbi:NUDIX family hydrolase [Aspergillus ellipticus CBS 707.79]|uniref:NUDIX family hydrolase n=1 Tax=Aspergillus ellipticus CBS 707.79 TaxID=1448320 RepID=A0A319D5K0_9EURO|nr:NUDIX family hydrolase [Aspergillus ellipticus CBS 707.79]
MSSHKPPKPQSAPTVPRPSSSVVLVSPRNEVLLLHRVKTSTSFASAHVFPGGNLSSQDGPCPPPENLSRHEDGPWYRNAAIRELFEESGILLAKNNDSGKMLAVPEEQREAGRRAIHQSKITFAEWLQEQNSAAVPDTEQLIPFTRWITPTNVPRRYTTQMYLYFLPLSLESESPILDEIPPEGQTEEIQIPTSDGGVEIAEARFLPASEWLHLAQSGEIILFPPQFLLLHLVAEYLDKGTHGAGSVEDMEKRRTELMQFVHTGQPPWTEKCICPKMLKMSADGRTVLALDHPGPELNESGRAGDSERVVLVRFKKGTSQDVDVKWKKDVFEEKNRL